MSTATAFADAVMTAIAKDKGWAPGPNAGWKRTDQAGGGLVYRYTHTADPMSELGHAMFADDESRVEGGSYGKHAWTVDIDELTPIEDLDEHIRAAYRTEIASNDESDLPSAFRDLGEEEFVALFDPEDIVDSAGAYDDSDLNSWVYWTVIEPRNIKGVKTSDGAVVWDKGIIDAKAQVPMLTVQKDKGWAPGPNAGWKRKDEGPAAAGMPEMGEGFDAWRERLYEGVKRGDYFQDEPAFYRAMSSGEFDAAMEAGEFRPLTGQDLYVTEDPDRLAGGAYGGKDGGYIVQFSPDLETRTAGSRTGVPIEETVVDRASVDDVVAVYRWDPEKQDHIRVPWDGPVQKAKWAPGPNAQWQRLDESPKLPRCRPPKFEDFVDEAGPADGERLDRAIASEIEADENGAQPIQWVETGGMEYLGAEWDKEFKALVQERLAERLEANEDFRRMVAASMGVKLEKVDPALVRDRVRELVNTWSRTAGDHDVEALLVQEAARQEFGLTNARAKDLKAMADQMLDGWSPGQYAYYRTTLESPAFAGYRAFVRAQYDETQEFLERAGIDEVLVYRGGGIPKGIVPPEGGDEAWGAGYVNVRQNPLTSWSTSATVASDFQVDGSLNQDPAIFATVVPRERILSTPATGNGCLREAEVVILGGETPAFMIAGPDAAWHNFDEVLADYDAGTLDRNELTPSKITEGAGND